MQKAAVCALKAWLQAKTGECAGRQKRAEVQKAAVCALKAWLQAKTGECAGRQKRGGKHGEIKTGGSDDGRFGAQKERTVAEKENGKRGLTCFAERESVRNNT